MQLSEKFRRGFVVALDNDSNNMLLNNFYSERGSFYYVEIKPQSLFDSLWGKGFFKEINFKLKLLLDDYEEEIIPANKILQLSQILKKERSQKKYNQFEASLFDELLIICNKAIESGNPIFVLL
jgi:hypothetical protein